MPALPMSDVLALRDQTRAGLIIRKLVAIYPAQIKGEALSRLMGGGNQFAHLCVNFHRANEALYPCGWQAVRTGGTPQDKYYLKPLQTALPRPVPEPWQAQFLTK